MAAASTPPSFYDGMAGQPGGGAPPPGAAPAPGGAPGGADGGKPEDEIFQAVAKVMSVLKKVPKMKDGTQTYIDRALAPLKEMVVDVLKKDPKDLDSASPAPSASTDPAAAPPAPPTPKPGEAVPAT